MGIQGKAQVYAVLDDMPGLELQQGCQVHACIQRKTSL